MMTDTSKGDPVHRLAELRKGQLSWLGSTPNDPLPADPRAGDADYWGFQTCTEFGFYQVGCPVSRVNLRTFSHAANGAARITRTLTHSVAMHRRAKWGLSASTPKATSRWRQWTAFAKRSLGLPSHRSRRASTRPMRTTAGAAPLAAACSTPMARSTRGTRSQCSPLQATESRCSWCPEHRTTPGRTRQPRATSRPWSLPGPKSGRWSLSSLVKDASNQTPLKHWHSLSRNANLSGK